MPQPVSHRATWDHHIVQPPTGMGAVRDRACAHWWGSAVAIPRRWSALLATPEQGDAQTFVARWYERRGGMQRH